jgi:hypothetical protein
MRPYHKAKFCWLLSLQPSDNCMEIEVFLFWNFINICFSEDNFHLYNPLALPAGQDFVSLPYMPCQYFNLVKYTFETK